jgi:tol-pal system protein YbgF
MTASMTTKPLIGFCGALLSLGLLSSASAGVFDDDEARKAILDLRAKVDAVQASLNDRVDTTSRGQLALSSQIESMRQDLAQLRGQIESLSNELANEQKRQKDYYADLDARLRKFEPQATTVDGKTATVDPAETRAYEAALGQFKNSDFKGAISTFSNFLSQYPDSAYAPAAQYWIGTSYYAQRDYKSAIAAQQQLLKNWPDSPRASEAWLNIASSQTDMADKKSARKSLETLIAQYPDSPAAGTARDRLAKLK